MKLNIHHYFNQQVRDGLHDSMELMYDPIKKTFHSRAVKKNGRHGPILQLVLSCQWDLDDANNAQSHRIKLWDHITEILLRML